MLTQSEGLHHGSIWPDESYTDESSSSWDDSAQSTNAPTYVQRSETPPKKGCLAALFGAAFLSIFATTHPPISEKEMPVSELGKEEALTTLPREVQELVKRRREKFL